MTEPRRSEYLFGVILAAFILHAALADNLALFGARPNLCLVALLICGLNVGPGLGAGLGLFAGLLEASYSPLFFGTLLATRLIGGAAVGSLEFRVFRDNAPFAFVTVLVGTPLVDGLFYLFAPQPNPAAWAIGVMKETAYHSVLALPVYYLIRRIMHGRNPRLAAARRV